MDKKMLSTVALVAGFLALVGGIWGLVEGTNGANAADIEDTFMWVAIDLVLLAIAAICSGLAARR
jgi:hypothetical protein